MLGVSFAGLRSTAPASRYVYLLLGPERPSLAAHSTIAWTLERAKRCEPLDSVDAIGQWLSLRVAAARWSASIRR